MDASNVNARVQHASARLLEMWSSGDLPAAVAKVFIRRQAGERPSDRWSLGNQLLCLLAGTDDARGFRQWQEVGRHVLKGSKAVWILGPVSRKVRDAEAPTDPGRSNDRTVVVGFRGISVFRLEDTEGDPVAVPDYTPPVLPPLAEVAEAWGVRVRYGPGQEGGSRFWGYYAPGGEICLLTHAEKVFFHELAHAAHHRIAPLGGGQNAARKSSPRRPPRCCVSSTASRATSPRRGSTSPTTRASCRPGPSGGSCATWQRSSRSSTSS